MRLIKIFKDSYPRFKFKFKQEDNVINNGRTTEYVMYSFYLIVVGITGIGLMSVGWGLVAIELTKLKIQSFQNGSNFIYDTILDILSYGAINSVEVVFYSTILGVIYAILRIYKCIYVFLFSFEKRIKSGDEIFWLLLEHTMIYASIYFVGLIMSETLGIQVDEAPKLVNFWATEISFMSTLAFLISTVIHSVWMAVGSIATLSSDVKTDWLRCVQIFQVMCSYYLLHAAVIHKDDP